MVPFFEYFLLNLDYQSNAPHNFHLPQSSAIGSKPPKNKDYVRGGFKVEARARVNLTKYKNPTPKLNTTLNPEFDLKKYFVRGDKSYFRFRMSGCK